MSRCSSLLGTSGEVPRGVVGLSPVGPFQSPLNLRGCGGCSDVADPHPALSRRRRLSEQLAHTPTSFKRDPEDPSAVALKEPWQEKVR